MTQQACASFCKLLQGFATSYFILLQHLFYFTCSDGFSFTVAGL